MQPMNAKRNGLQKHLSIRGIDPALSKALNAELRRRGTSLNQTVLDLLRRELGLNPGEKFSNGLGKLGGRWTEEEFREFQKNTAIFGQIDEELWK